MSYMYLQLTKTWLQRHLSYRARVVIWAVTDIAHIIIFPFIWLSVYGQQQIIQGYSRADIVTYYIIIGFIGLTATAHISNVIRLDIMEGALNGFLTKPLPYNIFRIFHELSYKIITAAIALVLFLIVRLSFPEYLIMPATLTTWLLFFLSLIGAFAISYTFELIIGFGAFWFGETSALNQFINLLQMVFSGTIAPLIFFPSIIQQVANLLPFKYLIYFPVEIYLNHLNAGEIIAGFTYQLIWMGALALFVFALWRRGLKSYEGVGI